MRLVCQRRNVMSASHELPDIIWERFHEKKPDMVCTRFGVFGELRVVASQQYWRDREGGSRIGAKMASVPTDK